MQGTNVLALPEGKSPILEIKIYHPRYVGCPLSVALVLVNKLGTPTHIKLK